MENQKFVSEMNNEELTKVFNNNEKLQHDVLEDMIESEMHWVTEQLDCFKDGLSDWSIGANNRNYITVKKEEIQTFIDGVIKVQKDFCLLEDKENEFIDNIEKKIDTLNNLDMYSNEFDTLEEEIEEDVKTLAEKITDHYTRIFDNLYENKYQLEYFTEFYAESRLEENAYINLDENSYTLYEDISYTKKYSN
jgi:hypothetical protein